MCSPGALHQCRVESPFSQAERSTWRWSGDDEDNLRHYGANVHLLQAAGHWLHTDNPEGLFRIMSSAFGPSDEDRMKAAISRQFAR